MQAMRGEGVTIEKLLLKAKRKKPMVIVTEGSLLLQTRKGIDGDVNAHPISPRHVLLVEAETLETHQLCYGALRENIVTRNGDLQTWETGTEVAIGQEVRLRITFPCEACGLISALQVHEPRQLIKRRGVLAVVVAGGTICVGDEMIPLGKTFTHIPTQIYERFVWVIQQIPAGTVIDYSTLIRVIGGSSSYLRALPGFIKKARALNLPLHRIVDSAGKRIRSVPQQEELLRQEGIAMECNSVNLARYRWDTTEIYYQEERSC